MSSNLVTFEKERGLSKRSEPGDKFPQVSLVGQNSIFGSIAGNRWPISTTKGFIPTDNSGGIMRLNGMGDVNPVWLGLDTVLMQSWAYDYCSPLAAVIDRLAQADTNGRVEFVDSDGATLRNVNKIPAKLRVKNLLRKPNPLQTWHEFNNEQVVICKKHGYCPVFAIAPKGADKTYTRYLLNISPLWITPVANTDFDILSEDDESKHNPIKTWRLSIYGKNYDIDAEDILVIKDGLTGKTEPGRLGLPKSKIEGLDYFISNICAAMEADNVLLKKKGPLGVFSYDQKPDLAGYTPMDVDDKDELQNELNRYGLTWGQLQYVISKSPIKWNPMSFNIEELKTKETIRMGIDGICDRFDYPAELMSGKNATYENRSSAERFLYQNNIIPFSLRRCAQYEVFFDIEGLVLDYDHLKVLQEDILHAGQAAEALSNSLVTNWEAGMISMAEYRVELGLDVLPGQENIYYPDYIKAHPELAAQGKTPKAAQLKPVQSGKAA